MFKDDIEYQSLDLDSYESFSDLPSQIQQDLIDWYNLQYTNEEEKKLLFDLFKRGNFQAWTCPSDGCDERVFEGTPDDWGNFQGTRNQDFSYFGNSEKYTEDFIAAQCDSCRCHG